MSEDWVPLAKRTQKRRKANAENELENHIDENKRIVDHNVERRTNSSHKNAKATLESQDGCAGNCFEYLDHTADVQFHVWGENLEEALENIAPCMFNYITDLSTLHEVPGEVIEFQVEGHDIQTLLFKYMDELLFRFSTDGFCCVRAEILSFDRVNFSLLIRGHGCLFDPSLHPPGTEIKAITYSNMQIREGEGIGGKTDIYVIVDI